ncbi:hypothetical protein WJX73_002356 [Symbiochloris irregularis]|uniref:Alpha-amylase n=1 Tax=Symbiochloris irregularis TaxID=706552 RepID=A0AAW1PWB9_9CHLO
MPRLATAKRCTAQINGSRPPYRRLPWRARRPLVHRRCFPVLAPAEFGVKVTSLLVAVVMTVEATFARPAMAEVYQGAPAAEPVMVQLFEWRWSDVAIECEEWLGPKGYQAVQISPPNEHIQGDEWWVRYQPVTYNLTSRSGTQADFADMVKRCSLAGIEVWADVVANHMAAPPQGTAAGIGGSSYRSRSFPDYAPRDFHHLAGNEDANCAVDNYADRQNVQSCDLVGLADLDTGSPAVRSRIAAYIAHLASLGVKGVRMDAAKHMPAADVAHILDMVSADRLSVVQEVIRGAGEAVDPQEYIGNGLVTEFGYTTELHNHFRAHGQLQYLQTLGPAWGLLQSADSLVFVDNHDRQRSDPASTLTYKDGSLYTLANVFTLGFPYGHPRVMSSFYLEDVNQGPPATPVHAAGRAAACGDGQAWVCEHRQAAISAMVGFHSAVGHAPVANWQTYADGDMIAFSRGAVGFLAINRADTDVAELVDTGLPTGMYKDIIGLLAGVFASSSFLRGLKTPRQL